LDTLAISTPRRVREEQLLPPARLAVVAGREYGRPGPVAGRCSKRDDGYVRSARNFLCRWKNRTDEAARMELFDELPHIYYAYMFKLRELDYSPATDVLQARLLSGQSGFIGGPPQTSFMGIGGSPFYSRVSNGTCPVDTAYRGRKIISELFRPHRDTIGVRMSPEVPDGRHHLASSRPCVAPIRER
jgi:hypothetical protein